MTGCFENRLVSYAKQEMLRAIDEFCYFSNDGQCVVIAVTCVGCGNSYEEEVEEARRKVAETRHDFLCLSCDAVSESPALARVTEKGDAWE